jgi:hypothetical protein
MTTSFYSQRDPLHAAKHYGLPQASRESTLGAYGCGITAIAQKLTLCGWPTTPLAVQQTLAEGRGFIPSGSYNYISWPRLPNLYPQMNYNGRQDFGAGIAPLPARFLTQIDARVDRGEPVIVYVDANRYAGGLQQHFVLIHGRDPHGAFHIVNPWNGLLQDLRPYGETDALAIRGFILLDLAIKPSLTT